MFEDARKNKNDCFYLYLASMVFCAFSIEAFLNHLGKNKITPNWDEIEKNQCINEKLALACKNIGYVLNKQEKPFNFFNTIFDFRDEIVHGKTEIISNKVKFIKENNRFLLPKAKWESMVTQQMCEKFINQTKNMIEILSKKSNLDEEPFGSDKIALVDTNE